MNELTTLRCFFCGSVVTRLPDNELVKLNGLNFLCECCAHLNLLVKNQLVAGADKDPTISFISAEVI